MFAARRSGSGTPPHHQLLDLGGLGRVEALQAGVGVVHDGVAAEEDACLAMSPMRSTGGRLTFVRRADS
jgi:hypothetical protein